MVDLLDTKTDHELKERLMNLCRILFTRYLLRQQIFTLIVAIVVCSAINVTLLLTNQDQKQVMMKIIILIIVISIWFFPLYLIVLIIINYFSLKKEKPNIQKELELYNRMSNKLIREIVVKQGIRVSIFSDKKTDFEKFNLAINEEMKFQRKKIEILKKGN